MSKRQPQWTNTTLNKNIRVTAFVHDHPHLITTMIDNTLKTANSPIAFNQLSKPAQNALIRSTGELALEYFENYGAVDSKREVQKHGAEEHIRQQQLLKKLQEQQVATNQAMADQTAAAEQAAASNQQNQDHLTDLKGLILTLEEDQEAEQVILDRQLAESAFIAAESYEPTSVTEINAINEGPSLHKGPSLSERVEKRLETDSSDSEQNSSIRENIETFLDHESQKEGIQFTNKVENTVNSENRQGPSAIPTPKP